MIDQIVEGVVIALVFWPLWVAGALAVGGRTNGRQFARDTRNRIRFPVHLSNDDRGVGGWYTGAGELCRLHIP